MEVEGHLLWPWAPGMRCLNNNKASLTWLVIQNALWVGKKLFSAQQDILPVVWPLCKLLEGYMVRVLNGKIFVQEASCVCSNVVPRLNRQEHYVFLCLLGIMYVMIWTTRKEDESFSSQTLVSFFKHQIKVKIRSERKRLFIGVWQKVGDYCALVSRGRSQPYLQPQHYRDVRILS